MSITSLPYSLRADNPELIMHMSLKTVGETYEISSHNLANFEPCLGYANEGQAVGGVPLQNTMEGPQYHPQPQPSHTQTLIYIITYFPINLFYKSYYFI